MDPREVVSLLAQGALFFVVASFGLQAHPRDVRAALSQRGLIAKGIVAVNLVVPAVAILMCSILPIEPAVKAGIIIMAVSPLAPLVPGKMLKGGLDASAAVGLYVALILAAVLFVPATVQLLSAIYPADASISVVAIARLIGGGILLPLSVGLAIAAWLPTLAGRLAPIASVAGSAVIAVLVLLILYTQGSEIIALLGDGTLIAIAVTVAAGVAAGHLLGGPERANSNALAMAAGIRHPGIAALIVSQNFNDRRVMPAVVLFLLTSVVVSALYQRWLAHSAGLPLPAAAK